MVRISNVYTKVGDKGTTHLGDGSPAPKSSARVDAYGDVDEANACIGKAITMIEPSTDGTLGQIRRALLSIQNELFDVGADLCTPIADGEKPGERLRVVPQQTVQLEALIDRFNKPLGTLKSFILPGGTSLAAELHVCRTVTRRAERRVAALLETEPEQSNHETLVYLNRLSDLLFVMGRVANGYGAGDVLWEPGATRDDGGASG